MKQINLLAIAATMLLSCQKETLPNTSTSLPVVQSAATVAPLILKLDTVFNITFQHITCDSEIISFTGTLAVRDLFTISAGHVGLNVSYKGDFVGTSSSGTVYKASQDYHTVISYTDNHFTDIEYVKDVYRGGTGTISYKIIVVYDNNVQPEIKLQDFAISCN